MDQTKIKCVVVEDEQHTTRLMENYISQIRKLELIGSFISPMELLNYDRIDEIQLIYLDIQMPGMTGVELLRSKPINAEVIFTTAYSEYALEGYDLDIADYLLKPVELPRFIKATNKAIEKISAKSFKTKRREVPSNPIMLKVDKKLVRVFIEDIIYIKADWNYVHVHTSKKVHMILSTLKAIEMELMPYDFIRVHKSFLINLLHFESIEGNIVQLTGNVKLNVSRNYKRELLDSLSL